MKIHRVVQMLGATTSTGKLADDMYDLGHKDYYSEAEDRYIPISHMDFQHMVRAFVKQNEEDVRTDTQEGKIRDIAKFYDDVVEKNDRIYKKNLEETISKYNSQLANAMPLESWKKINNQCEKLQLENVRLVQRLEHDETVVSKEAYQVMWDNCKELEKQVKHYKKLAEDNFISSVNDSETSNVWKERYEHELSMAEHWKDAYYKKDVIKGCGYVFSEIPNDTDGQEFVDNMKKYFNKKSYKMRVRGQHVKPELRGTGVTSHGQNIDESTHLRVYIDVK
tara:strand:+ start:835 stop:1671 length:837 start_codon:yes stop_codon:yes gene_type:complete